MRRVLVGFLFLAIAATAWMLRPRLTAVEPHSTPPERASTPATAFRYEGTGSCAASACHGNNGPAASKGSEYTTWMTDDPHSKAYTVLYTERSRRMVAKLKLANAALPEKTALCLGCHALNAAPARLSPNFTVFDGVGCENCHGPAEKWLAAHVQAGWKQKSADEKQQLGMRPTKNLVARGSDCARCHVGSADADVGHLLLAAGHPRLRFEYSSYLSALPKHWSEKDEKTRYPDFKARVWAVGQVVSSQAALELLAERARDEHRAWPEFAEYDCFACHHDLRDPGAWPGKRAGNLDGLLTWGTWYLPGTLALRDDADAKLLRDEMRKSYPDRKQIHKLASGYAGRVGRELGSPKGDAASLQKQLDALVELNGKQAPGSWDEAAQRYVALTALHQTLADLDPNYRNSSLTSSVETMAKRLTLPKGYDSPHFSDR